MPKQEAKPIVTQNQGGYEYSVTYLPVDKARKVLRFSDKEILHLSIAALLVTGVGLSLFGFQNILAADPVALSIFVVALVVSFFAHEMAHKLTAQKRGLWAEFRLTLIGAALTLLSTVAPFFKIISPGAVMVGGMAGSESIGRISIAGPITNIALSTVFMLAAAVAPQGTSTAWVLMLCAGFNAWIALFNLIPFGMLDGFKVFLWNKAIWALVFTASIVLTAISYGFILSNA
jgi:Zn-dependent protease